MPSYYQSVHSVSINAPQEKIYEALTDWALRQKWRPGMTITWEGDSKAFVGQRVTFRPNGGVPFSFRITGLEPFRRFFMEYEGKPFRGRAAMEITPQEGGCQVAFHWMKVEPVGWIAKIYFALGFGMRTHQRRSLATLQMLKEYLEK